MHLHRILSIAAACTVFTAAFAESPAERKAEEMCLETAEDGDYSRWSVKNDQTCKNSSVTYCVIVRKDGVEQSHKCPLADSGESGGGSTSGGASSSPRPQIQE